MGVPHLVMWLCGPSSRICFAKPKCRSRRMYGGIRITTSANASSRPWISSRVTCPSSRPPRASTRPSTTRSSATPRDALTRTTSPGMSRSRRASTAEAASATTTTRSGPRPAARAPWAIPSAAPPGPPSTTTRRSSVRPGGLADLAVAGGVGRPELPHLAQRPPRGGPAARPGARGRPGRNPGRRCSCRPRSTTPPARITTDRWGAVEPAARPGSSSSRPMPAARPTAAAASALWTARRPRAGIATARSPAGVTRRNRMPSNPAEATSVARTSARAANP